MPHIFHEVSKPLFALAADSVLTHLGQRTKNLTVFKPALTRHRKSHARKRGLHHIPGKGSVNQDYFRKGSKTAMKSNTQARTVPTITRTDILRLFIY